MRVPVDVFQEIYQDTIDEDNAKYDKAFRQDTSIENLAETLEYYKYDKIISIVGKNDNPFRPEDVTVVILTIRLRLKTEEEQDGRKNK